MVKYESQKSIGIRLQKFWNEKKVLKLSNGNEVKNPGWELEKNNEGYFKIGKITDGLLQKYSSPGKIEVGDIILSINDIDLREIAKDPKKLKILESDISDLFEKKYLHIIPHKRSITILISKPTITISICEACFI